MFSDVSTPLAITPLTERCFMSLMTSISSMQSGGLVSPDTVGKRSTITNLAHLCGQHLFQANCSQFLGKTILSSYIKGFISSGSWLLFDKYDSLSPANACFVAHELERINGLIKAFLSKTDQELSWKYPRVSHFRVFKNMTNFLSKNKVKKC